jgi:glycosyltransferase involved in cell wall biosynthesis
VTGPGGSGGRPLRILQVAATAVGGAWFRDQVTGLARRGHDLRAVLPGNGPLAAGLRAADVPVEIIPFGLSRRPRQWPALTAAELRLLRLVREFRPDVIHAHLLIGTLACRVASLGWRPALVVSQVPGMPRLHVPWLRWLDRCTLRRDDVVIGSCQAIADRYRAMGARSVAVSYYGCDVHALDPLIPGDAFRREFGLAPGTPAIGMIAHMYRSRLRAFSGIGVKGHEVFIDAAPLIRARIPGAAIFVIGDELAGDRGYRRELQARAARLDAGVIFTGHRPDIAAVLAGLDVIAVPSLEESACYAAVEALLMGKGVVASNVGGLPDTIRHGHTGLLVPPGDPAALAAAITGLLTDPARRHHMAQQGRAECLHRFDIDTTVAQVEAVYRAALRNRDRP